MSVGSSGPRVKGMNDQLLGQEVKGEGHTRPKVDLEAWQRRHSGPLGSSNFQVVNVTYWTIDVLTCRPTSGGCQMRRNKYFRQFLSQQV